MDKHLYLELLRVMLKIRLFEKKVVELFRSGELPGWLHSYIGEEAVATGVCLNLNEGDYITSTHRGHGHCIAKGVEIKYMMAELYAKETGCCKGRGGSMHIADVSKGVLGANAIVGGGIPIATGAAFACKYLNNKKVVVSFFGDGATNQGSFHESLNLASVWKLPIVYLCENNLYAETNPVGKHLNIKDIAVRADAYNIEAVIINGMDVLDVYGKMKKTLKEVREGKGPILVEAKTYRYCGHYDGDPEVYREQEEIKKWREKDPIKKLEILLKKEGFIESKDLENIKKEIELEIKDAITFAKGSPEPDARSVLDYVFT